MGKGFCLWLTGLSASGKTTLAGLLRDALTQRGFKVEVLDGDEVRKNLSKELGFSCADRVTNLSRITYITGLLVRNGVVVVVGAICPYESSRQQVRAKIGDYVEVFLNCPLEVCMQRDTKGLYHKALSGEIKNFTGIDDPFEVPRRAEIEVKPHEDSPKQCLCQILHALERFQRIPLIRDRVAPVEDDRIISSMRL
jgi:adenylylsulfate kinase